MEGYNPLYDCFSDCQENSWTFGDAESEYPITYEATYTINNVGTGEEQWNHVEMWGSETTPGMITLYGQQGGLDSDQEWYIMYQSEQTTVAYYCGNSMSWHFEGLLVLSKVDGVYAADQAGVDAAITSLGISLDEICQLSPETECPSTSFLNTFYFAQ